MKRRKGIPKPQWVHEKLAPAAWAFRLARDYRWFSLVARVPRPPLDVSREIRLAFVVGCGRSGTTILGDLLDLHPSIRYWNEPIERWAAVDLATDTTGIFRSDRAKWVMDASDVTPEVARRFRRLFRPPQRPGRRLVEKLPVNAMRLDYLSALAPNARFIVIVRDARGVINSIVQKALNPGTQIFGKEQVNGWWWVGDIKWRTLQSAAAQNGWLPEELLDTQDEYVRAACEWIGTCESLHQTLSSVGDRAISVRYEDLVTKTDSVLVAIAEHLHLASPSDWLKQAQALMRPRKNDNDPILPDVVKGMVNEWQERLGYLPIV
jgi:hypothetical protein